MPQITAIVPHKDCNELLPRALESIRLQGTDTETIVIDNASRVPPTAPGTRILLNHRDFGLAYSMNRGYREARSPICAMVCADDELELNWFRTAIELMEDPTVMYVSPDSKVPLCWPGILENNTQHMGAVFKRELILKHPYRDGPYYDWDLWCRLAKQGIKGISLPDHYYNWYWREGSLRTQEGGAEIYSELSRQLRERILSE